MTSYTREQIGRMQSVDPVFAALLRSEQLPIPVPEYRFHPSRKWRMDFAWPQHRVYLEVDGGVWSGGRHTRGSGFARDIEKHNAAAVLGWRLIRCQPRELCRAATVELIREALKQEAR